MGGLTREGFNQWWDSDGLSKDNSYEEDTPAFWAWEGWQAGVAAEREKVAKWMMERSYATGHGDTIEDLLGELDWQVKEQREWQRLTDEEKQAIYRQADAENWDDQPLLETVEAKLKAKNAT